MGSLAFLTSAPARKVLTSRQPSCSLSAHSSHMPPLVTAIARTEMVKPRSALSSHATTCSGLSFSAWFSAEQDDLPRGRLPSTYGDFSVTDSRDALISHALYSTSMSTTFSTFSALALSALSRGKSRKCADGRQRAKARALQTLRITEATVRRKGFVSSA